MQALGLDCAQASSMAWWVQLSAGSGMPWDCSCARFMLDPDEQAGTDRVHQLKLTEQRNPGMKYKKPRAEGLRLACIARISGVWPRLQAPVAASSDREPFWPHG